MDSEGMSIREEYVDMLVQEFAYDPIRLPPTEDPAQVLYNRRTLETIWDAKQEAVNPFTRQPFNINNVIPQAELRQEMHRYITNSSTLNLRLEVIPDYTKVLSKGEMKFLLNELISDYHYLIDAEKEKRDQQAEHHWKRLWQKLNLLRLYCQYRQENRDVFCSIRGYEYLSLVVEGRFYLLCHNSSSTCDDAKEIFKEIGRIVDIIGLKESDLPPNFLLKIVTVLCRLTTDCDHLKIHGMVLRNFCRMFHDLNIENLLEYSLEFFCFSTVHFTLYVLERENFSDVANEDLYNGMAILKAAWMKKQKSCIHSMFDFVGVLVDSVILCISRFHYLHNAAVANEAEPRIMKKKNDQDEEEPTKADETKNVHLISVALEEALSVINSIVTDTSEEGRGNLFFAESKKRLQELNIVREIVRMVELVLSGFQYLESSHLQLGINIVAALHKEEDSETRNDVDPVFGDFLRSDIVDEYDSRVKLLLQEIILHNGDVSEQA